MIGAGKRSLPKWASLLHALSFYYHHISHPTGASAVLFSDGKAHSIETSLNDFVTLRSSSRLLLLAGHYTIRSPPESESAIRLSMSSALNATGGDVVGGDATEDRAPAVGVIVGSASRAQFWDGVTVRGGNCLGGGADGQHSIESPSSLKDVTKLLDRHVEGQGGDALVSQHFGSNATIHGGNFIAGKGSAKDGYSLHAFDDGEIYVHGGSFYGAWMARSGGSIVVTGCLSRIGTRLVGRLQDGLALDVQLVEEGGGEIIVNNPEKCNTYRKSHSSTNGRTMGSSCFSFFGVILLCLRFAFA